MRRIPLHIKFSCSDKSAICNLNFIELTVMKLEASVSKLNQSVIITILTQKINAKPS